MIQIQALSTKAHKRTCFFVLTLAIDSAGSGLMRVDGGAPRCEFDIPSKGWFNALNVPP